VLPSEVSPQLDIGTPKDLLQLDVAAVAAAEAAAETCMIQFVYCNFKSSN
jgi:hypothetical protein